MWAISCIYLELNDISRHSSHLAVVPLWALPFCHCLIHWSNVSEQMGTLLDMHAQSCLSSTLMGWILNYRLAKWPSSRWSSLAEFIAVLWRDCLPLCRQLPAGVWTNRLRAWTGRKGEKSRAKREEGENAAQLLAVAQVVNGKEKAGWHFVGGHKDGMQCSLGAKVKAAVVQVASVLRSPVTLRCGLLSPDLI